MVGPGERPTTVVVSRLRQQILRFELPYALGTVLSEHSEGGIGSNLPGSVPSRALRFSNKPLQAPSTTFVAGFLR
jgi:hypothetical protein